MQTICTSLQRDNHTNTHTHTHAHTCTRTHTHTRLTALFPGLHGWAGTRKVKPIWILLKQETVSGSGISWAMQVCTSLQTDNHASTPQLSFFTGRMPFLLPNQQRQSTEGNNHTNTSSLNFYRPDALSDAQPTVSAEWLHCSSPIS